jgi:carbamoyltransferase
MKINISKEKDIVGIWGIQDGSGYPGVGWTQFFPTHDHSFCIVDTAGAIKYSIELERLSRVKHDRNLHKYIESFDKYLPEDFIVVSVNHFAGTSFLSENALWRVESSSFEIADLITPAKVYVNRSEREGYVCSHELAHVGSILPFVGEFKENSLLIHIDGLASESCFSVFQYKNGMIKYLHHGWEPLCVTQLFGLNDLTCSMLGLDENHRLATPGRLMGYSSYGRYSKKIRDWLKRNDWYKEHWKDPNKFFLDIEKEFGKSISAFDLKNKFFMNIAKVCQQEFEEEVFSLIEEKQEETGAEYLYFSGGSALNINLNTKLFQSKKFGEIYVPPCCSDTGLALGAASIIHMLRNGTMKKHSPFICNIGVEDKTVHPLSKNNVEKIVDKLSKNEVMGVSIGYSESGPRALGHRSIMAIPTSQDMYKKVNTDIKKREWYRPLAPIITDQLAEEVFPNSNKTNLSRYMLSNFNVNEKWLDKLPAIVHVDKTARVQVIYKNDLELKPIYQILLRLWEKYHIPCLINTSFNGPGEPIVHTDKNVVSSARKLGLDFVLIDDEIVDVKSDENKD